ncbi:hypothetical protein, partial [Microbacterium sp. T32]|uniref:hypothetical protein n=1 Tax=Microbacterium sp. T32 TaxID=1776083 RepID=UPI000A792F0D
VSKALGYTYQNWYVIEYTLSATGSMRRFANNEQTGQRVDTAFNNIPTGTTLVGAQGTLSTTGDLYWGNTATPIATGVSKALGYTYQDWYVIEYTLSATGSMRRFANNEQTGQRVDTAFNNIPTGTTLVGAQGTLSTTGDLYWGNTATPIATGVSKALGYTYQ